MRFIKLLFGIPQSQPVSKNLMNVSAADINKVTEAPPVPEREELLEVTPKVLPQELNGFPLAYNYANIKVCIIRDNKPDYDKLKPYMPICFIPEPSNPYDPKAVIVKTGDTNIGYLYRGSMQDMVLDFLRRGDPIQSFISDIDKSTDTVQFSIGFYKEKREQSEYSKLISSGEPYKVFKLTGNRKEDMQDTLSYCDEEEEVEYEFDYDKEKYVAICGGEIGYFPKSAEKYLENEHPAFIELLEEDDDDKYVVKVAIFFESE
ncbi:MAG: hypothetical protein GX808_03830 [Syntrophomonadaceae bacterium]|jgi:hypothetical protein|nr:hypothetical protein [Syntrophomonadaceae bacterium]